MYIYVIYIYTYISIYLHMRMAMYIFTLLIICSSTRLVRVGSLKPNHDFSFAKLGPCTTVMIIAFKKTGAKLKQQFSYQYILSHERRKDYVAMLRSGDKLNIEGKRQDRAAQLWNLPHPAGVPPPSTESIY